MRVWPSLSLHPKSKAKSLAPKLFTTQSFTKTDLGSALASGYFSLLHSSPNLKHLRHLHARLLRTSLYGDVVLSSKLVLRYSQLNRLTPDSLSVFHHMPCKNVFSWNIVIGEFSRSEFSEKSIELFVKMWRESDDRPDDFTLPLVLKACASSNATNLGISIHSLCVKLGFDSSLFAASALVTVYVCVARVFDARKLFDEMPTRDAVLWTTMLGAYVQHGEPRLCLKLFREMVGLGIELDWVVMMSLFLACSQLGLLKHGKSVHAWCVKKCAELDLNLGNSIVDMYVKCAKLSEAHKLFDKMPVRDVISWSSLIVGYGLAGNVHRALDLFDDMLKNRFDPNGITFLGVLSACAHGGLVDRSLRCLELMRERGVVPELKHYASVVDCLSRAGLLQEAENFVEKMPVRPDEAVLGAVLGACRVYGNVEVGERIAKKLVGLEPEKAGYYVTLANVYASAGRFEEAARLRCLMKDRNVAKVPGHSFI